MEIIVKNTDGRDVVYRRVCAVIERKCRWGGFFGASSATTGKTAT